MSFGGVGDGVTRGGIGRINARSMWSFNQKLTLIIYSQDSPSIVILGSDASPPFGLHIFITMALHREDDEMHSLGLALVH